MTLCYLGLGSNLADPAAQIKQALNKLKTHDALNVVAVSSLYCSQPMGPKDQPDYMNAVVCIETQLAPVDLLDVTQSIELDAGRVRKGERWGARILDIDILLYGNTIIDNERLTVPHYGMKEREFVLIPLAEIAPALILPCQNDVATLAENINKNALTIHSQLS